MPCVVQDWSSGEVLTLAYMNAQALQRTRETGELHLWSRSRGEQWHKGATSGNVQTVRALRLDCDGDTLLALVEPAGPACHTGERTCFHRGELEPRRAARDAAGARAHARRARARAPAGSYTVELLDDPARIGEKVMEEAEEVARAAREESDERVDEEAADVLYHLLVLLRSRGTLAHRRRAGARWPSLLARRRRRAPAARDGARASTDLEQARALARAHNLIPLSYSFVEDCETPVSAFLKLRALAPGEPAFLLESAEQGQRVGRWSFIGFRPRAVLRWSLADGGDPYALAAEQVARFEPGADGRRRRRSPAARWASSATTSCARSSRSASPDRRIRSGCPTWR